MSLDSGESEQKVSRCNSLFAVLTADFESRQLSHEDFARMGFEFSELLYETTVLKPQLYLGKKKYLSLSWQQQASEPTQPPANADTLPSKDEPAR